MNLIIKWIFNDGKKYKFYFPETELSLLPGTLMADQAIKIYFDGVLCHGPASFDVKVYAKIKSKDPIVILISRKLPDEDPFLNRVFYFYPKPIRYLFYFTCFFYSFKFNPKINMKDHIPKLKLLIIVIALACVTKIPVHAQFRIGVTGGPVLSSLIRDSNLNARAGMVGYMIGAVAKLNVGELGWFFQSGVNYTLEGDNDQNLNFIKIPLTIGFDASDDVNVHVAYNLAWQVGNHNNVQEFYHDFANILGVGFEIYISERFAIGSRLNYGLSNLVKDEVVAKNLKVIPFTFDLYITYFFK
ncbi:MAG: outer membrane beta-barrel protein [Cyclobacteriaceae bacterium]|nr:outer membrane beta-barrel protein [Cyclobacteriaceae bacterium]